MLKIYSRASNKDKTSSGRRPRRYANLQNNLKDWEVNNNILS